MKDFYITEPASPFLANGVPPTGTQDEQERA